MRSYSALLKTYFVACFPLQTTGRKLWALWRNFFYRLAALVLSQDKLVLYSSLQDDKFCNITAVAQQLTAHALPFQLLTRDYLRLHPFRALLILAQARVLVIDAASPAAYLHLHRNTSLVHCWHAGGAYKKVGFDAKRKHCDDMREEKRIARIHRDISWFVCSSEACAKIYAQAFRLPLQRMLVFGIPRLDAILQNAPSSAPTTPTILYAPTYRTREDTLRYMPSLPDATRLRTTLAAQLGEDVCLAFRAHPTTAVPYDCKGWEDWSQMPQHEALCRASILVTDYSSIFFDFLPFHRPIIFYVPDFDNYQRHERELYFSPYDVFPDTTCSDEQTLIHILENCCHRHIEYADVWQHYMSACDGRSSERICTFIQKLMKENSI